MAQQTAITLMRRFERNEDKNYHAENRVMLAKYFGTPEEAQEAKELYKLHMKQGHLPMGELYERVNEANKLHFAKLKDAAQSEWDSKPASKRRNKPYYVKG